MSDAVTCDGPDCTNAGHAPFLGWMHLTITGTSARMDFCSLSCLGGFVMNNSGTINAFEQALAELRSETAEKPAPEQ